MNKKGILTTLAAAGLVAAVAPPALASGGANSGFEAQRKRQFAVAVPGDNPRLKGIVAKLIKAFNEQGRFQYVAVEIPGAKDLDAMRKEVSAFLKEHAAEYAGQGEVPDAKFGDVALTPGNVRALLSSAYLFIPDIKDYPPKDGKPVKSHFDLYIYNTESGGPLKAAPNPLQQVPFSDKVLPEAWVRSPDATIRVEAVGDELWPTMMGEFTGKSMEPVAFAFKAFNKVPPKQEDIALRELLAAARRLDAFLLRSYAQQAPDGELKLAVGRNIGVELDSVYEVQRKEKVGKTVAFRPVGWVKVRQTEGDQSQFQTINQQQPFEAGDRLVERPQSGLDAAIRLGMAPFDPTGGSALAPALMVSGEYDLAPLLRMPLLSETFFTAEATFIQDGSITQPLSRSGASYLIGLEKRFVFGQLSVAPGFRAGSVGLSEDLSKSGDVTVQLRSSGYGVAPTFGLDYQLTPELKIGLDASYILATSLTPSKLVARSLRGPEVEQPIAGVASSRTNMSGPTASISATFSF